MTLLVIGTIILLLIVYYCIVAYSFAYKLSHPKRIGHDIILNVPFTYEKFDIHTTDEFILKGLDIRPKMATKGTIIVCHYLGGSKELVLMHVDFLVRFGFRVITFDFRNHGESERDKRIKFKLEDDFIAFYKKIKDRGIDGPLGIIGFSMGATAAIEGIVNHSDIKVALIDSGPLILVKKYFKYVLKNKSIRNPLYRMAFLFIYLYYAGFNRMSERTINRLKSIKNKKLLIIHGENDKIIPMENAQTAHMLTPEGVSELWRVPNAKHLTNRFLKRKVYEDRVTRFFVSNLANEINNG